jgi:hypothetical protein
LQLILVWYKQLIYPVAGPLNIKPMRHNPSTVVVLTGAAQDDILVAVSRSRNVAVIRPATADATGDGLDAAAEALGRAGRATSPYALVAADPLAALAASWQAMWDVSRPEGTAGFEREAATVLAAWRAGRFELPDYYLVLGAASGTAGNTAADQDPVPDFYLGPLRSTRPHRVAFVPPAEPAEQAIGALHAVGSLRHGPWWPGLDDVIDTARHFYPGALAETGRSADLVT